MENKCMSASNYLEKIRNAYYANYKSNFSDGLSFAIYIQLEGIIKDNLDHLFTESFINYLGSSKDIYMDLQRLHNDHYSRIELLTEYFNNLFVEAEALLEDDMSSVSGEAFFDTLDSDLKNAIENICCRVFNLDNVMTISHQSMFDIINIINITFAYYLINNREGNIYEMCDLFLNEPEKTIDIININNVKEGIKYSTITNRLIDFVIYKLENRATKEIK